VKKLPPLFKYSRHGLVFSHLDLPNLPPISRRKSSGGKSYVVGESWPQLLVLLAPNPFTERQTSGQEIMLLSTERFFSFQ
jgi:hypothetical protein